MKEPKRNYVICIRTKDSSDIEVRKVYEILPDEIAAKRGYLRVVDESGEDYLYPKQCFAPFGSRAGDFLPVITSPPAASGRPGEPIRQRSVWRDGVERHGRVPPNCEPFVLWTRLDEAWGLMPARVPGSGR